MEKLNFYQRYQITLLTLIIGLFVVLVAMRLFGLDLSADLQDYKTAIWSIILLLVDPKELQHAFFTKTPGGPLLLKGLSDITDKEKTE